MHFYSYDGCDSDSPASDPLSGSDSEASTTQSQRSLVILLDDEDDEDEIEQPVHPLPSYRPKRPLPRNFSRSHCSPVKEEMAQGMEMPSSEVYHTISCTPGLRDKSLEELRVECYRQSQIATRKPPGPVASGMNGIPPSFFPWRESEQTTVSSVGQVESSIQDVPMDE